MNKTHLPVQIESERIILKKHDVTIAKAMFQYVDQDRERLMRFLPWVKFTNSIQDEIDYIKMTHEKWDKHELYDYGIFLKSNNTYMGNVGVHTISWSNDRCEIGYWILGRFEGQGYMSEAVKILTESCFEIGFNRVEVHCDPQNHRSAKVPKQLSFRFEACLTQHAKDHQGLARDTLVFARLKSDGPILISRNKSESKRPEFIKHWSEIQDKDDAAYANSNELLSIGSPLAKKLGLTRIGIHHEVIPPGRRTSWPHAESAEEEFGFVIEGSPDVWINGNLHRLNPGDAVAFPAGTGIAHTFINNTSTDVRMIVVGERLKPENKIYYPLHPELKETRKDWWFDHPIQELGTHDGLPDRLRRDIK